MSSFRIIKDRAASGVMFGITILALVFVVVMGVALYIKSMPILAEHSLWELVSASSWQPFKNNFGFLPFVMGTIWVTAIAIVIALPLSLMTAVFLTEYAKKPVKKRKENGFSNVIRIRERSAPRMIYSVKCAIFLSR